MAELAYSFRELLSPLEGTREAAKLAIVAGQVKIEQAVLAEIMFNGNTLRPDLDFYLEEARRDLTVRRRQPGARRGALLDWIEAKMCYTDCLARRVTRYAEPLMYRDALRRDVEKQRLGVQRLRPPDRATRLTALLIALHHEGPVWRHKYYPGFRNRRRHSAESIEAAALEHVRTEIAPSIGRPLAEHVSVTLAAGCRLHVFAFHDGVAAELDQELKPTKPGMMELAARARCQAAGSDADGEARHE